METNFKILKRILQFFKPYVKNIIYAIICVTLSACINVILPIVSKQIIDKGLLDNNFSLIVNYSVFVLILVIVDQGIKILETANVAYVNSMIVYTLNKICFKHLLRLKLRYYNNVNTTQIVKNLDVDINNIAMVLDRSAFYVIDQIFKVIGGTVGLILLEWKLTFLIIFLFPLKYIFVKYLSNIKEEIMEQFITLTSKYYSWLGDTINGIKEVKLFHLYSKKTGELVRKQKKIIRMNVKIALIDKINDVIEVILDQIIVTCLYIIGAIMIFDYKFSVGGLFAFITYSIYVTNPISAILNAQYNFSNILPSARRLFDFLDKENEENLPITCNNKLAEFNIEDIRGEIVFENVSFSYENNLKVLVDINFKINSGEKVAIVGVNGSGKTTIINLLLRFYKSNIGRILIDGIDINNFGLIEYRHLVSASIQNIYLFNSTIRENIILNNKYNENKYIETLKNSQSLDIEGTMDNKYIGSNGTLLSGGQKQKIGMARTLYKESKVLILDEATSNYDILSEENLYKTIQEKFKNKTVLYITHRVNILKYVDKVIMLDKGKVCCIGNHADLCKNNQQYKDFIKSYDEFEI